MRLLLSLLLLTPVFAQDPPEQPQPEQAPPEEPAAESPWPDYVQPGQRLTFSLGDGLGFALDILEVSPESVSYRKVFLFDGRETGQSERLSWPDDAEAPEVLAAVATTEDLPRRNLEVGDHALPCAVIGAGGVEFWVALHDDRPTFPGQLRGTVGGDPLFALESLGAAPAPETYDPQTAVAHVRVGQRYVFILGPARGLRTVWEVTGITETQVLYTERTYLDEDELGEPTEASWTIPDAPHPLAALAVERESVEVGEITLEGLFVGEDGDGVLFTVTPSDLPSFPPNLRVIGEGRVALELVEIQQPETDSD